MPKGTQRNSKPSHGRARDADSINLLIEGIKNPNIDVDTLDNQTPAENLGLKNSIKIIETIKERAEKGLCLPLRLLSKAISDISRIVSLDTTLPQNLAISKSTTAAKCLVDIVRIIGPANVNSELRKNASKLSKASCELVCKALSQEDSGNDGATGELLKICASLTQKIFLLENHLTENHSSEQELGESCLNTLSPKADPPLECVRMLSEYLIEKSDLLDEQSAYQALIALNDFKRARIQRPLLPEHPVYAAVTNAVTLIARSFSEEAIIFDRIEKVATALAAFFPEHSGFMQDKIEKMFETALDSDPMEMAGYCQAYRVHNRLKKAACSLYAKGKFDEAISRSDTSVSWKYAIYAEFALMPPVSLEQDLKKDAKDKKLRTDDIFRLAQAFYALDINPRLAAPLADTILQTKNPTANLEEHTNMLKYLFINDEVARYIEYFDKFLRNSLPATTRKPDLIKTIAIYEQLTGRKIKNPAFSYNYTPANSSSLEELYLPEIIKTLNKSGVPYSLSRGVTLHGLEIDVLLTLRPGTSKESSLYIDFDGSRYHSVLSKEGLRNCGRDKFRDKFAELFEINLIVLREEALARRGLSLLASHHALRDVFDKARAS
jgi:hypothetical protein